jgi:hypothetical protein
VFKISIFLEFLKDLHHLMNILPFTALQFAQMIETDEDFSPFPGGYDYLVDFLDLSFPKERPSREHPYEEVSTPPPVGIPSSSSLSFSCTLSSLLPLPSLPVFITIPSFLPFHLTSFC